MRAFSASSMSHYISKHSMNNAQNMYHLSRNSTVLEFRLQMTLVSDTTHIKWFQCLQNEISPSYNCSRYQPEYRSQNSTQNKPSYDDGCIWRKILCNPREIKPFDAIFMLYSASFGRPSLFNRHWVIWKMAIKKKMRVSRIIWSSWNDGWIKSCKDDLYYSNSSEL